MNAVKKEVKALLDKLPDDCTFEDIQYHLYVMGKIQRGIKSLDEGKVIPHKDAAKRILLLKKIQNGITRAENEGTIPQRDVERKFFKRR